MSIDELFEGCEIPPPGAIIIDPFTGNGEIIKWAKKDNNFIISYDIEPQIPGVIKRNVFIDKPSYYGAYVITRCPIQTKIESEDKTIFEQYHTDNLYKCFIQCLIASNSAGGCIIVPTRFISGNRESEIKRRNNFFKVFKTLRFNIFNDTIVISFRRRMYTETREEWKFVLYPEREEHTINIEIGREGIIRRINIDNLSYPKKAIYISFTKNLKKNIKWKKLYLDLKDLGLHMVTNLEPEDSISIRGFMSTKSQEKLCNDYDKWVKSITDNRLNQIFPITSIDAETSLEIIRRLIWSYYCPV